MPQPWTCLDLQHDLSVGIARAALAPLARMLTQAFGAVLFVTTGMAPYRTGDRCYNLRSFPA